MLGTAERVGFRTLRIVALTTIAASVSACGGSVVEDRTPVAAMVHTLPGVVPSCPGSTDPCVAHVARDGGCELVALDDVPCGETTACQARGMCRAGSCVRPPAAPLRPLRPLWSAALPGRWHEVSIAIQRTGEVAVLGTENYQGYQLFVFDASGRLVARDEIPIAPAIPMGTFDIPQSVAAVPGKFPVTSGMVRAFDVRGAPLWTTDVRKVLLLSWGVQPPVYDFNVSIIGQRRDGTIIAHTEGIFSFFTSTSPGSLLDRLIQLDGQTGDVEELMLSVQGPSASLNAIMDPDGALVVLTQDQSWAASRTFRLEVSGQERWSVKTRPWAALVAWLGDSIVVRDADLPQGWITVVDAVTGGARSHVALEPVANEPEGPLLMSGDVAVTDGAAGCLTGTCHRGGPNGPASPALYGLSLEQGRLLWERDDLGGYNPLWTTSRGAALFAQFDLSTPHASLTLVTLAPDGSISPQCRVDDAGVSAAPMGGGHVLIWDSQQLGVYDFAELAPPAR